VSYPFSAQPGPRPGPPPGGPRVVPPGNAGAVTRATGDGGGPGVVEDGSESYGQGTGHPAVDAALRALDNAAGLAPAEQIAAYEAAHQVFQETLAGIDG
jgi:hypothetical protein